MPKIRGIKPETWTDDKFVRLSPLARLLFIGMWNLACDNGHVEDNAIQLKIRLLPMDSCKVPALVDEMVNTGQVERHDGFLKVIKLAEHQHIDMRWLTLCEWCEHDEHATFGPTQKKPRKASARSAQDERKTTPPRAQDADGDGDGDGELKVMVKTPLSDKSDETEPPDTFEEFWESYSHKVGRKKAETAYRAALKKPGITADLLIASAAAYITWQMSEGKHPQFTKHPATWLHGEHWRDERPARAPQPQGRVQEHLALVRQLAAEEHDQAPSPFALEAGEGR